MELWKILDDEGKETGELIEKSNPRIFEKGIYHLGADVWIINNENKILIQKRSKTKFFQPNVWAMTGGSVILNETPMETIVREAKEELNIEINADDLRLITKFKTGNVWMMTYILRGEYNIAEMKFQESEVADAKWATFEEVDNLVKNGKFIKNRWEFVSDIIKKEIKI